MGTRKVTHRMRHEWVKLKIRYLRTGLAKSRAYTEIARQYGVSYRLCYNYLEPGYWIKERKRHRQRMRLYLQKPGIRQRQRDYSRRYMHLRRHLSDYLFLVMRSGEELPLEEILDRIGKTAAIRMSKEVLECSLQDYQEKLGSRPLTPNEHRLYLLNREFPRSQNRDLSTILRS